jgi:hypothetical protein
MWSERRFALVAVHRASIIVIVIWLPIGRHGGRCGCGCVRCGTEVPSRLAVPVHVERRRRRCARICARGAGGHLALRDERASWRILRFAQEWKPCKHDLLLAASAMHGSEANGIAYTTCPENDERSERYCDPNVSASPISWTNSRTGSLNHVWHGARRVCKHHKAR